jgi:hypothetical protein
VIRSKSKTTTKHLRSCIPEMHPLLKEAAHRSNEGISPRCAHLSQTPSEIRNSETIDEIPENCTSIESTSLGDSSVHKAVEVEVTRRRPS